MFAVNALAPFILNARLKPVMMRVPGIDKYIVNVSAMEGKFYRFKTPNHPHTNMVSERVEKKERKKEREKEKKERKREREKRKEKK